MTHGALFNGIAGFPLAAAWAGIPTAWTVEIDEFCNKVSKKHFPDAIQYTDIHEARNLPYVDIISGGFPCQPFSSAGKQRSQNDNRFLWPEMLRIIREVRPAYVIGENVAGIINLALDEVLNSLEVEGYTTETFIIPACAVGAPHIRNRVWIVAYTQSQRVYGEERNLCKADGRQISGLLSEFDLPDNGLYQTGLSAHASSIGERKQTTQTNTFPKSRKTWLKSGGGSWWLSEPAICGPNDGIPGGLVRDRAKQLKAYGNAIVPQVAFEIFKAIKQIN